MSVVLRGMVGISVSNDSSVGSSIGKFQIPDPIEVSDDTFCGLPVCPGCVLMNWASADTANVISGCVAMAAYMRLLIISLYRTWGSILMSFSVLTSCTPASIGVDMESVSLR